MTNDPTTLVLRLDVASGDVFDTLESALLRARASELAEVRRRTVRLSAGYGDATTRETMDDESRRAQARYDAVTSLLEALRSARRSPG